MKLSKVFKVIAIADSSNAQQTKYIRNQVNSIKNQLIDVEFIIENENSMLFNRHSRYKRIPCYMVFKNNAYKTCKYGKVDNEYALEWIKANTS